MFARLSIKSLALSLCLMLSIGSALASPAPGLKGEMTAETSAIADFLADSQACSGRGEDSCTARGVDLTSRVIGSGTGDCPNATYTVGVKAVAADILQHRNLKSKSSGKAVVMFVATLIMGYAALKIVNFVRTSLASARRKRSAPFEGFNHFVPDPHWYLGHINLMAKKNYVSNARKLFVDHADPSNGISTFWHLSDPAVSFTRSQHVQKILNSTFHRDVPSIVQRHLGSFLGKTSLLAVSGSEWMANRTIVHRAFVPAALLEFHSIMSDVARRGVDTILRQIDEQHPDEGGKTMSMLHVFKMLSLDSVGIATLGRDFGCTTDFLTNSIVEAYNFLASEHSRRQFEEPWNPAAQHYWIPTPANFRHWRANVKLRKYLGELIKERRREATTSAAPRKDLLARLISASADSEELSDEYLSDFLVTILFAGLDTTANLMAYAFYLLATNPECEEKCVEEVRRVLGSAPKMPESFHWTQLPYCQAVLLETMRLYPPGPQTVRSLVKSFDVDGFTFPAGTKVFLNIWWIHRDPENFSRPLEFLPERWVRLMDRKVEPRESAWEERNPETKCNGQASTPPEALPAADKKAFFAFSGGGRSCVGQRFAMQSSTITLATFIRELKMKAVPGYVLESEKDGLTLKPSRGLPMIVTKR